MRAEHGVRPNAFSFTGALKACGAASRWQLTLEVRELMVAKSVAGGRCKDMERPGGLAQANRHEMSFGGILPL